MGECEFAVRGHYSLLRLEQLDVFLEWRPWKSIQSREFDFLDVKRRLLSGSHSWLFNFSSFARRRKKKSSSYF